MALLPLTNPTQCQIGRLTIVTATLRTNRSGFKQLGAPAGPTDVVDMVDVAVDVVDVHRLARQSGEDSRATHGPWVMGHGHGPWLAAVAVAMSVAVAVAVASAMAMPRGGPN